MFYFLSKWQLFTPYLSCFTVLMVNVHICILSSKWLHFKYTGWKMNSRKKINSVEEKPKEQQQQKLLTDNYIKRSEHTVRVMSSEGGGVFHGVIRPPMKKNATPLPYLVCFQPSVWRILQRITRAMCNSNPPIVCAQIQYISRSLAVTCN